MVQAGNGLRVSAETGVSALRHAIGRRPAERSVGRRPRALAADPGDTDTDDTSVSRPAAAVDRRHRSPSGAGAGCRHAATPGARTVRLPTGRRGGGAAGLSGLPCNGWQACATPMPAGGGWRLHPPMPPAAGPWTIRHGPGEPWCPEVMGAAGGALPYGRGRVPGDGRAAVAAESLARRLGARRRAGGFAMVIDDTGGIGWRPDPIGRPPMVTGRWAAGTVIRV